MDSAFYFVVYILHDVQAEAVSLVTGFLLLMAFAMQASKFIRQAFGD